MAAQTIAVLSPQDVVDHLQNGTGRDVSLDQLKGLCTRVVTHVEGFNLDEGKLNDQDTPYVFLCGPEWIHACMTKDGSTQKDWMLDLGLESDWMHRKVHNESKTFTLLVFRLSDNQGFVPTWENIFDRALAGQDPHIRTKVLEHRNALQTTEYAEIEEQAKSQGLPGFRKGDNGHGHLTPAEYLDAENTLVNCRRFLRKIFNLTPLFTGDGSTLKEDGKPGWPEMMVENVLVAALPERAVMRFSNDAVLGKSTREEGSAQGKAE